MELRDYIQVLRARKWLIIQAAVIVTLAALLVSYLQPSLYQGRAKVLLTSTDQGSALLGFTNFADVANLQPERSLATQVELILMRPLGEMVVRKLNLGMPPDELLSHISVSGIGQTDVLEITATDDSPQRAADMANAMAEAYVQSSRDAKRESIKNAADEVQRRLDDSRAEILALGRRLSELQTSDQGLQAELTIATNLYATLAEKLEALRVSEQLEVGPARLVSAAVIDENRVAPRPARNAVIGLFVGLVFGVCVAFLLEYLDNTIKSTEEAEKLYGAPVLGQIPLDTPGMGEARRLTIVQRPGSPAAESYRVLRNSLDFINFQHDIKVVLVASSAPGEGKSTVAANLAAGLAHTGKKVALVNSDFRRPTTDQFFSVNNAIGLSDVLTGRNSLKSALQRPTDEQLLVLVSGKMPPNPSELLGSEKMSEVMESLKEWAEWIIVDSPPLLAVADAAAIARWADGTLMVTRGGTSTREAARKGRAMLEQVGARVIGVVVWGLEEASVGGGYYGGYYYGGYTSVGGDKRGRRKSDSGARGPSGEVSDAAPYEPEPSTGRRIANFIGRAMAGILAFLVVVAIAGAALYAADRAFGWGLLPAITRMLGLG